jgi:outer membrane putative beta-barrel porin/alpha-amylase
MPRLHRILVSLALLPSAAGAQALRSRVSDLFRFGDCGEALCLQVNAAVHGLHYAPSATATSGALIDFFTDAIGNAVANVPISSSSGGVTFSFRSGAPVKTSVSSGPIFAERAQTLGRGRVLAGANVTGLSFRTFRGLPLDEMEFNFNHQNVGSPVYGDPEFENDVIQVRTSLDLSLIVTTAFVTYGLLDNVDIGVAVPLVRTSLSGTSTGEVIPFGPNTPHFFGTPGNQSLTATGSTDGSSTGLGDIAARVKINLAQSDASGFALFGDVRLPTGSEEDFRGSGDPSVRALGVWSARYGNFSPHVNGGVLVRTGDLENNAALVTAGFDHLLTPSVTFALDVLSEIQLGENKVPLPAPVQIAVPFARTVVPTNLPGSKDHIVRAAFGAKYTTSRGLTALLNALVPMRAGRLQPSVAVTAGLEYSF